MDAKRLQVVAAALAVFVGGACGGGGGGQKYPDASVTVDGASDGIRFDRLPDSAGQPPQAGAGSRLLVSQPEALLIGSGQDSCTNQLGATGDRWCGFTKPSTFLGNDDLWVINASAAVRGATINCRGADPNCIRVSSALFVPSDAGVRDASRHVFDGDTLIFYADNRSNADFTGTVYAWRPGWSQPRRLTSDTGVICGGSRVTDSAYCFGNRDDSIPTQVSYDLTAGKLKDAADSVLPTIEKMLLFIETDPEGVQKFQAALSPAGDYIAWSARPDPAGVETLQVQKLGDPATRKVVAADVSRWSIAPDSQTWYWLKQFNHDTTGKDAGTLEKATFPDGGTPTVLATNVAGDVGVAGTKGLIFRTDSNLGVGELKLLTDRDNAATATKVLDTGVIAVWGVAPNGQAAIYSKNFEGQIETLFDLHIATATAPAPCLLVGTTLAAPSGTFSAMGQTAVWAKIDNVSGQAHGYYTNVATCTSSKYASNILAWSAIEDEGYVYLDDRSVDGTEVSLRFTKVTDGMFAATGTIVQTRATPIFASLLPVHPAVLYTVMVPGGGDGNGIYINASLPFSSTSPPPPPDAGAVDATATDGARPDAATTDGGATDAAPADAAPGDAAVDSPTGG